MTASDPREAMEQMFALARGEQGAKGDKGAKGEPGLPPALRRAIVYLFVIAALLSGANLYWTAHEVHSSHIALQREQVAQQRQGRLIEQKLCITFGTLASLKPPPGNPAANPSRAYEDHLHAALDQLGTDLGCR